MTSSIGPAVRRAVGALAAAAVALAMLVWAGDASAATRTFDQVRKTPRALVFEVRGIEPRTVRGAYATLLKERGGSARRKVSVREARRAARGKRLKLRRPERVRRGRLTVVVAEAEVPDDDGGGGEAGAGGAEGTPSEPVYNCAPQPGALTAPGCQVVFEDTAQAADPIPLWGSLDCASASRHQQVAGGDPYPTALGASQGDGFARRLSVLDGDDYWGERCELGQNDHRSGPTTLYREGDHRLTFFSLKLGSDFPLSTTKWQVVMQMKQSNPADNGDGTPVLALWAQNGQWVLEQSDSAGPAEKTHHVWSTPAQTGSWTRFALDVVYSQSSSQGYVKVYVDLNGDGDALDAGEQSPGFQTYTLKYETAGGPEDGIAPGTSIPSHLRIGPYHAPEVACPGPGGCSLELDNVQVVNVS